MELELIYQIIVFEIDEMTLQVPCNLLEFPTEKSDFGFICIYLN